MMDWLIEVLGHSVQGWMRCCHHSFLCAHGQADYAALKLSRGFSLFFLFPSLQLTMNPKGRGDKDKQGLETWEGEVTTEGNSAPPSQGPWLSLDADCDLGDLVCPALLSPGMEVLGLSEDSDSGYQPCLLVILMLPFWPCFCVFFVVCCFNFVFTLFSWFLSLAWTEENVLSFSELICHLRASNTVGEGWGKNKGREEEELLV